MKFKIPKVTDFIADITFGQNKNAFSTFFKNFFKTLFGKYLFQKNTFPRNTFPKTPFGNTILKTENYTQKDTIKMVKKKDYGKRCMRMDR